MGGAIPSALNRVLAGIDLTADEMHEVVGTIMDGRSTEVEIAALLTALAMKTEAISEIVGAARAMRERAEKISTKQNGLLDTCGTGGDALLTFNISTATAVVAAAAGVPVAKHGNRSVSSSSGSADVLEALGVNVELTPPGVSRCLDEIGIGFCFARLFHGAMKHAAGVRKQLGFRTIFNLLGPLTNPAAAEFQLLGANRPQTAEKLARALGQLGTTRAAVVCGNGELDEVSLWGKTSAFVVADGKVTSATWTAASFGLPECSVDDLRVDSAEESAETIRKIFSGELGPARDIVLANAAAAFLVVGQNEELPSGVQLAADTIDSGKALEMCRRLAETSQALA
jgi:anthranilate phosphoribosyltransferase